MNNFEPISLQACVYVLELKDKCFYVGATFNLNVRMGQHFSGRGSQWTRIHAPLKLIEVIYPMKKGLENQITLKYMREFGKEKVRGGNYCKTNDTTKTNGYTLQQHDYDKDHYTLCDTNVSDVFNDATVLDENDVGKDVGKEVNKEMEKDIDVENNDKSNEK